MGPPPPASLPRGLVLDALVELRDVAPTLLEAAGLLPADAASVMDGRSLLCHLADGGCPSWRSMLDLEHSTCYNASNHWSALVTGEAKYVFNAQHATEQLFNLTADPYEATDLASSAAHTSTLRAFREALVAQFQREQRGPAWVLPNGTLPARPMGQMYGPNYPQALQTLTPYRGTGSST